MLRSIYACRLSSLWTVHPLNVNTIMKRIHGILLFIAMWLLMESRSLLLVHWPFFYMKVDCSFNPCVLVLILYTSPFPLLCGCMNPHQRWTMHLSLVDMAADSFFSSSKASWSPYFRMGARIVAMWQCLQAVRMWSFKYATTTFIL